MNNEDTIIKYNKTAKAYAESRIGTEDMAEIEAFSQMLKPGAKLLDVGCAGGRDTRIFKDLGFDVTGSDLAEKLLDIARVTRPDIPFVFADMRKLPFENASFDVVWASAVLHHVDKEDMRKALLEFERILARGIERRKRREIIYTRYRRRACCDA